MGTAAIDTTVDSVTDALRKGAPAALIGFGTISVSQRTARNGRNPQAAATIKIAARKVANFTPGSELKKVANQGKQDSQVLMRWSPQNGLARTPAFAKPLAVSFSNLISFGYTDWADAPL